MESGLVKFLVVCVIAFVYGADGIIVPSASPIDIVGIIGDTFDICRDCVDKKAIDPSMEVYNALTHKCCWNYTITGHERNKPVSGDIRVIKKTLVVQLEDDTIVRYNQQLDIYIVNNIETNCQINRPYSKSSERIYVCRSCRRGEELAWDLSTMETYYPKYQQCCWTHSSQTIGCSHHTSRPVHGTLYRQTICIEPTAIEVANGNRDCDTKLLGCNGETVHICRECSGHKDANWMIHEKYTSTLGRCCYPYVITGAVLIKTIELMNVQDSIHTSTFNLTFDGTSDRCPDISAVYDSTQAWSDIVYGSEIKLSYILLGGLVAYIVISVCGFIITGLYCVRRYLATPPAVRQSQVAWRL